MTEQMRAKKGFITACAMFAVFYMSHGVYYPYITLYYKDIGITVEQIGMISAIGPLCALIVQPIWGRLADKTSKRNVWMLTVILSGIIMLLFSLNTSFLYVFLFSALYVLVASSSQPLMDTIALDYCHSNGFKFSVVRMFGTVGFGLMPLFVGGFMENNLANIFPLYALFCFSATAICFAIPQTPRQTVLLRVQKKEEIAQFIKILKDPFVVFMLFSNFVLGNCLAALNFLPVYATDIGVSANLAGKLSTVSAAGEILLFLVVDFFLKKIKSEKLMLISVLFMIVRLAVVFLAGFTTSAGGAFITLCTAQGFHAISYIMLYYCSAQTIHKRVADDFKATAQTMITMISMGLSRITGSLFAGWAGGSYGLQYTFLFFMLFALVAFLPAFILYRRDQQTVRRQ